MPLVRDLKEQRKLIDDEIKRIQMDCPHPDMYMTVEEKSNYSYKDPFEVLSEWKECECLVCERKWIVEVE